MSRSSRADTPRIKRRAGVLGDLLSIALFFLAVALLLALLAVLDPGVKRWLGTFLP